MRTLLSIELEAMQEADLLLVPLLEEAASIAPATKIGFLLLYALTTGQEVEIVLVPFDPIDYLRQHLNHLVLEIKPQEKSMRQTLQKVSLADAVLAVAEQAEIFETYEMVKAIVGLTGEKPDLKQVKQTLLGQTELFTNADNIRRVRALVQAHLETMKNDPNYPDLFSLHVGLISTPLSMA